MVVFRSYSASDGLVCLNSEQKWRQCDDYKVKFTCTGQFCSGLWYNNKKHNLNPFQGKTFRVELSFFNIDNSVLTCRQNVGFFDSSLFTECRTRWFDHDDPTGNGDYEVLSDLLNIYPRDICPQPIAIEVQTISGEPAANTSDIFLK